MKIVLDDVASGYQLSKINANFQKIEDELNNKVLYKLPPEGEANALEQDMDVNGKKLYNLPTPTLNSQAATKRYVDSLAGATEPWIEITEQLLTAASEADAARDEAALSAASASADADIASDAAIDAAASAASINVATLMTKASNLSDVASVALARGNLGLGTAAVKNVGTSEGNVVEVLVGSKLPVLDGSNLTGITVSAGVSSVNGRTGAVTLTSGDVTTALGYTPPSSMVLTSGAVGSYRMAVMTGTNNIADGGTISGSSLRCAQGSASSVSAAQSITGGSSTALTGTWRNMTGVTLNSDGVTFPIGLWQRTA